MTDLKQYRPFSSVKRKRGFTLIEMVLVMVLLGIAALMVVPFVGHIFSNLLEGRELSHREGQAVMALERFVRDVRGADSVTVNNNQKKMTLENDGSDVIYEIVTGNLLLDGQVLAKHLDDSQSKFDNKIDTLGYQFITLTLVVEMSGERIFELSASSFPRMISAAGGNQGGGNQGGGNQGGGNQGGGNQGGGNQGGGNQGGGKK
jgi:prepilin-type N-terminal cleavage/methylation domain-containing protein